jgi:hypothetical protein
MSKPLEIQKVLSSRALLNAKPIEIIPGEFLPSEFGITFSHSSLDENDHVEWITSLQIRTENDGIPRVIAVTVEGDVIGKSRVELAVRGRVDQAHLEVVAREIRHLEARAAEEFMKVWLFNEDKDDWVLRIKSQYFENGKKIPATLTDEQLKKIRRIVEGLNSYTKRSPEFLREVARIYNEAKRNKKRTNLEIQKHFEKKNGKTPSIELVQSWVKASKASFYIKAPAPEKLKNSTPAKSVGKEVLITKKSPIKKTVSASKAGSKATPKARKEKK